MKKRIIVVLVLLCLVVIAACGEKGQSTGKRVPNNSSSVNDVLQSGIDQSKNKAGNNGSQESGQDSGDYYDDGEYVPSGIPINKEVEVKDNGEYVIDVDLTKLSATMVYTEVYNMMTYPEDYVGKTVKMKGQFASLHDEVNDVYYFACIVKDATACCAQGIEFVTTDEFKYPDSYPAEGEDVTVVGVFDTYWEGNLIYCTLRNSLLL